MNRTSCQLATWASALRALFHKKRCYFSNLSVNHPVQVRCQEDVTTLVLESVTREDVGHYACAATNMAGRGDTSDPVYLDVLCKMLLERLYSSTRPSWSG